MSLRNFCKYTTAGRITLIPLRFFIIGVPFLYDQLKRILRWVLFSKEYYNYTYDLTDLNRSYLANYIAVISEGPVTEIERFIQELDADERLRQLLIQQMLASPDRHSSDVQPRYGRRLGWYAVVRVTKPRTVVETGVDRGLGTAVIAAALRRNEKEGFPGLVYATDINPQCGHLLADPYKAYVRILLGDSVESLRAFKAPVDIFLHDSDHRPEYEWAEFMAIEPRLHPASLILSDNSHQSSKLLEFAQRLGKRFLYFQDQPRDHWWPGDGIGAAFIPGVKTFFPDQKT